MSMDLYKGTLPYAATMFGVYQSLIGWRARQARARVAREREHLAQTLVAKLLKDSRVQQLIRDTPHAFKPDTPVPGRVPAWLQTGAGRAFQQAVARFLAAHGRPPAGAEWATLLPPAAAPATAAPTTAAVAPGTGADRGPAANPLFPEAVTAGILEHLARQGTAALDALFAAQHDERLFVLSTLERPDQALVHPDTDLAFLSPLGLVHLYREYFFDVGNFLGPPVGHVWVSPGTTLELYEVHTRRRLEQRMQEQSLDVRQQSESSSTTQDELSTAVNESNSRNMNFAVSATGGVNFGVASASASASFGLQTATQTSSQEAHKQTRQTSAKQSNDIRREFKTSFKTEVEAQDRSSRRYVIQNGGDKLINYELRRKMRKVGVQVQHVGTRLCWQCFVDEPGQHLGIAELVHVARTDDLAGALTPPDAPQPMLDKSTTYQKTVPFSPIGDIDDNDDYQQGKSGGNQIKWRFDYPAVPPAPSYVLTAVDVRLVGGTTPGKDMPSASISGRPLGNGESFEISLDYVNFRQNAGVQVEVDLYWHFPKGAMDALNKDYNDKKKEYTQALRRAQHQEYVTAVKERVKLASNLQRRPEDDLRQEERTAIFRTLIGQLTHVPAQTDGGLHVTSELLQSIFDVESMLYFVAPNWWKARRAQGQQVGQDQGQLGGEDLIAWGGAGSRRRDNYLVTEDSTPAPMGASLGWMLQLDGDERRNSFLNSPWVKAVVPIRPGKEQEALAWLTQAGVEGIDGLDEPYRGEDEYKGPNPATGKHWTLREVIADLVAQLTAMNKDIKNIAQTEKVYETGFDPLPGGFQPAQPLQIFDQWTEVLPTEQIVAVEYEPNV